MSYQGTLHRWLLLLQKTGGSSYPSCEEISTIQKEKISKCDITFITENDNFLLHIAEVFVSCELRSYWNSFETH